MFRLPQCRSISANFELSKMLNVTRAIEKVEPVVRHVLSPFEDMNDTRSWVHPGKLVTGS